MRHKQILLFLYVYLLIMHSSFNTNASSPFGPNPLPPKNTLRVVSYNIHFGMGALGKPNIFDISKFLASLQADIICLQEVDRSSMRSFFMNQPEILSSYLSMNIIYEKTSNILSGETGNLILSKFPIIETTSVQLPHYKYPRNAMEVVIDTPYGIMKVINTHLGLSKDIRQKEIAIVGEMIYSDGLPTLLVGDFNTKNPVELNPFFPLLKDSAVIMGKDPIHTFESPKYGGRIDYILTSKDFQVSFYDVAPMRFSDHYPIIADIVPSFK